MLYVVLSDPLARHGALKAYTVGTHNFFLPDGRAVTHRGHFGLCDIQEPQGLPLSVHPPPPLHPSTPAGGTGEVGLPAEDGESGEDVEEALVCPETGADSVLQVPGETPLPQDCGGHWKRGSVAHSRRAEVWQGGSGSEPHTDQRPVPGSHRSIWH